MRGILEVFACLELVLLSVCTLTWVWGYFRRWEIQLFIPVICGVYGTVAMVPAFLVTVFFRDHVHFSIH